MKKNAEQDDVQRRLKMASALCATFITVETVGGLIAGSLTVLSDAAHLMADLAAFGVAIAASHFASQPASNVHTYGLKRVEALAALFSVSSLALLSVILSIEALRRLWFHVEPLLYPGTPKNESITDVDGKLMTIIASIGVVINIILALVLGEEGHAHGHSHDHDHADGGGLTETTHLLHEDAHKDEESHGGCGGHDHSHGHEHDHSHDRSHNGETHDSDDDHSHDHHSHDSHDHQSHNNSHNHIPPQTTSNNNHTPAHRNINLHSAYLHVLGDLLQSIAVLIAGITIWFQPTWTVIDPLCTILFCILVVNSTRSVFRTSLNVLLEGVPLNIEWDIIFQKISRVGGVTNVHDLHIWSVSHGTPALSVHLNAEDPARALEEIAQICREERIGHPTIQVEEGGKCTVCSGGVETGRREGGRGSLCFAKGERVSW